ncbi:MAG: hypothetical protein LPK26_04750 [Bacillaceae bacterium]|nr:hypothetical protein [Bacillaceae bacterium]
MLKESQFKAIELLVEGRLTVQAIADHEEVDVSRGTLYNWMKNNEFKEKLEETMKYKSDIMKESLKGRIDEYIDTLESLRKKSKNDMARYQSSQALLNYAGWSMNEKKEVSFKNDETENKNALLEMLKSKKQEEEE